jgi:hypothetical protein
MTHVFNDTSLDDDDAAALRLRYQQLVREFEAEHPVKASANKFVTSIYDAARGDDATRVNRERERARAELFVSFDIMSNVFANVPQDIEDFIFSTLLRLMLATYALGQHAAPEGRSARAARSDRSGARAHAVEAAVRIYLENHLEEGPYG